MLKQLLQQGENEELEFKTSFGRETIETLVAFAKTSAIHRQSVATSVLDGRVGERLPPHHDCLYRMSIRCRSGKKSGPFFVSHLRNIHRQATTLPVHLEKGDVPVNVPVNDPINVPVNERQQWFLDQLRQGIHCGPADIAAKWDVVLKTAKTGYCRFTKKRPHCLCRPTKNWIVPIEMT